MSRDKPTGRVKWFKDELGYGFIAPDHAGDDLFVHHSKILMEGRRTLAAGELVEYRVVEGDRGPQAADVVRLEPSRA